LLAYGPDQIDTYRRAATYVDRILRGAKAGDLPVQFPTKYEMVVNLKTAKALGLTVPQSILLRADEVIVTNWILCWFSEPLASKGCALGNCTFGRAAMHSRSLLGVTSGGLGPTLRRQVNPRQRTPLAAGVASGSPKPASRAATGIPSYVNAGSRCNVLRELPAGHAVVPPINGSVCAVGGRTF
jgi:hypothetical protein